MAFPRGYEGPMDDEMLANLLSQQGGSLAPTGPRYDGTLASLLVPQQSPQMEGLPQGGNYIINHSTGVRTDLPPTNPQARNQPMPDYAQPIEVGGFGKGYRMKGDPYKVVLQDGRIINPFVDQAATAKARREGLVAEKAGLENDLLRAKVAGGGKPSGSMQLTEIVDPANPSQMIRIDARSYQGGSVGSPGVIGTSGKEPGALVRDQRAEVAQDKKAIGRQEFNDELDNIESLYAKLNELKGLPSTSRGALSNIASSVQSSGIGQLAGKAIGSEEQRIRDELSSSRMRVMQAFKNATGMTATQMNSNVELQTILSSLGDPSKAYEANLGIIDQMRQRYGGGGQEAPQAPRQAIPTNSVDYQQTLFNAKKAIAKNPAAREAILQKMQAAGYDTKGL